MQVDTPSPAQAQAIDWLIRQRDPGFADWDGFADWLAENPDHAHIYDALASMDRDLDELPSAPPVPTSVLVTTRRVSRRAWIGGAVAAALVAAVSLSGLDIFGNAGRIETAPGEHRTVELADGSRIEINGGSILKIDKDRPRFAQLESGEAMFHVVHREGEPFIVEAGGNRIVDLGTAFNVVRRDRATSVAVSEGIVLYNPDRHKVRLVAGQAIDARDDDGTAPVVRSLDIANVGGWRSGLLVYDGAPLSTVADDLRRTAGISVRVETGAADVAFRGALVVDRNRERTVADLAALSGTSVRRQGDGWVLSR